MKELSIFVDESGDFGAFSQHCVHTEPIIRMYTQAFYINTVRPV